MASAEDFKPAILCAESIALLHLLHTVPSLPRRNKFGTPKHCAQTYALSLEEERLIADSLAYISNDSEDVHHISALCIEEQPTTSSLNVLLAANSGNGRDQRSSLQRIKAGLEGVFATLIAIGPQRIASHPLESDVFDAIILMCSKRILLRLRLSQKQRGSPKQAIQTTLASAINSLGRLAKVRSAAWCRGRDLFVTEAKRVNTTADAWRNHQTHERLRALVESVYRLKSEVDLDMLFHGMTSRDMDPSTRKSLVNTINKIARYREIARCLYRLAKRNSLLSKMQVITVNLPTECFRRLPKPVVSQNLGSILPRVYRAPSEAKAKQIRRLINAENGEVNIQFTKQVLRTLTESKVHAEIQILYHLELNPPKLAPRVVASSKDACFLCNAFISMHGKLHTSRTHGRLYPGWRLPFLTALADLEQRFNQLLASQISASIATLLSRGHKTAYPDPNESTLLTLPYSTSTVCTHPGAREDREGHYFITTIQQSEMVEILRHPEVKTITKNSSAASSRQSENSLPRSRNEQRSERRQDIHTDLNQNERGIREKIIASRSTSAADSLALPMIDEEIILVKGEKFCFAKDDGIFKTDTLHLFVETPHKSECIRGSIEVKGRKYRLEWLDDAYKNACTMTREGAFVDAEALEDEKMYKLDNDGCIHISAGGDIIRVQVSSR